MIRIYNPENTLEAQSLKELLASHHIHAHISGMFLQGAIGELPTHNLIGLEVDIADAERARELIDEWLKAKPVFD